MFETELMSFATTTPGEFVSLASSVVKQHVQPEAMPYRDDSLNEGLFHMGFPAFA
jgi:hypothetical protein